MPRSPFAPNIELTSTPEWHLARRACPAPTAAIAKEIKKKGRKAWLEAQLNPSKITDTTYENLIKTQLPWTRYSSFTAFRSSWQARYGTSYAETSTAAGEIQNQFRMLGLLRARYSKRHLQASMMEFWLDHFSIPYEGKSWQGTWSADYKARTLGMTSFRQILHGFVKDTKVITYLDNQNSGAADANGVQKANENLARELLELYTVGSGRYSENDVKNLAILLTGHSVDLGAYEYRAHLHINKDVTIRGKKYKGARQPVAALDAFLDDTARHRDTARLICTKIARRFVSDNPPASLIDRMVVQYLAHDTKIVPVLRTMFLSAEFERSVGQKWRRPGEYCAALTRISGASWKNPETKPSTSRVAPLPSMRYNLRLAGHDPRAWPSPDGYPDKASYWMASTPWLTSMRLGGYGTRSFLDPQLVRHNSWTDVLGLTNKMTPAQLADTICLNLTGYKPTPALRKVLITRLTGVKIVRGRKPDALDDLPVDRAVRAVLQSPLMFIR